MKFLIIKKQHIMLAICVIIATVLLVTGSVGIVASQNRKLPIYCVNTDKKQVAISFDAAWGNDDTETLIKILKEYKGDYLIESFNPFIVKEMKKYLPDALYGQLYYNRCRDKKKYDLLNVTYTGMMLNVISRPDFLAYDKNSRNSIFVKLVTKLYKRPQFVWTPRGQEEIDLAKSLGEYPIFELYNK